MARLSRKASAARKRILNDMEFLSRELKEIDAWRGSLLSGLQGAISGLLQMRSKPEFRLYLPNETDAEVMGWLGDNPPDPRSILAKPIQPPRPTIDEFRITCGKAQFSRVTISSFVGVMTYRRNVTVGSIPSRLPF